MKTNYKKTLKLVTLLISSFLISFVSAATYSELYIKATPITIGAADVKFVDGANTTNIGSINSAGTIVTFTGMSVDPGEEKVYEQAVNITNTLTSEKTISISLNSLTGPFSANFEYINITVIDNGGLAKGTIYITSSGQNDTETGNMQIPGNNVEWTVMWIIKAKPEASPSAQIDVELKMRVS